MRDQVGPWTPKRKFNVYQLEYDNDRAGSFEVLKHLPLNKKVVLGIITTKTAEVRFDTSAMANITTTSPFL